MIVFGGWNGRSDLSTVAEFSATDDSWSKLGDLQQPRHGHSAITNEKTVLVIGGSGKLWVIGFLYQTYHVNEKFSLKTKMFSDTERYRLDDIEDSEDFEWSSSIEAPFLDTYSGQFSY